MWRECTLTMPVPKSQPAPVENGPRVYPEVYRLIGEYGAFSGRSTIKLRCLMESREQVGLERYGVPLSRDDGRDTAQDAREEVGDLLAYATSLYATVKDDEVPEAERLKVEGELREVMALVAQVYSILTAAMGGQLEGVSDED